MAPKAKPTKDSAKAMVRNGKKRMARPPEPTEAALSPPPLPPPSLPAADPPYPISSSSSSQLPFDNIMFRLKYYFIHCTIQALTLPKEELPFDNKSSSAVL